METAPRRKLLRLRGFDYSSASGYFVTVCTSDRVSRFGDEHDGQLSLSPAGVMIAETWESMEFQFPSTMIDAFIVMPDHFHAVLYLATEFAENPAELPTLGKVMQWFKTVTTDQYIRGMRQNNWPTYNRKLWQRYYNDHIIRNTADLKRVRDYIEANPTRWSEKHNRS